MKKKNTAFNYVNIVNIIFSLLVLLPFFYAVVGSYGFGYSPMNALPSSIVIILASFSFVLFIVLLIFNAYNNSYRPNFILMAILIILFIINSLTIICFKSPLMITVSLDKDMIKQIYYSLDTLTKVKFIFQFGIVLALTFLIVDVFPKIFKGIDLLHLLAFLSILFAIFLTVYSMINEKEFYTNYIYNLISEDGQIIHARAIFPNKNSYSIMLFLGMVASLFLHNRKHHFFWLIPAVYLFVFIMISFCKTLIIISPIYFSSYLLFRFLLSFKEHKVRNLTSLVCFAIFFSILGIYILQIQKVHPDILEHVYTVVFKNSDSYSSIDARENIWINSYNLMQNFNIIFGLGFNVYGDMLYEYMFFDASDAWQHIYAHNTVIEILGNGGLIFLSAYFFLLGYLIYVSVKIFPKYKTISMFSLITAAAMLGWSLVESGSFIFPFSSEFTLFSAIIFIPVMNKYHLEKKLNKINQLEPSL